MEGTIKDEPRYAHRGISVDSGRHFRTKDAILNTLKAMSSAKLNKLHLRLSDDEGWRIESTAYPKLHEIGSKRCADETKCILP